MPQTAVVLGGSSDLAAAVLVRLAERRLSSVLLAGRDSPSLSRRADELRAVGVRRVETAHFDVTEVLQTGDFAQMAKELLGSIDLVVVATGYLGSSGFECLTPEDVAESITTNFTGPAAAIATFVKILRSQGYGRVVVLSSAAGVRVRRVNLVYGAAKAGLDGYCQGVRDTLAGSGVDLMIVRPGFVHTKMTAGRNPAPFAIGPAAVGDAVVRGLERNATIVWVPWFLRPIFAVLRFVPGSIWRRLTV